MTWCEESAKREARSQARIRKHINEMVEAGLFNLPPYCPECGGGGDGCPKCRPEKDKGGDA